VCVCERDERGMIRVYIFYFLGALMTRTPSDEKEEDMASKSMLSGITCFCRKDSPPLDASMLNSWPLSLMVMSSGVNCCMLRASLYSLPSLTLRRTVASAVWVVGGT